MSLPSLEAHGFSLEAYLGQGSEGIVYKGAYIGKEPRGHIQPGQAVALKFSPADKLRPAEVLFQARLQHINIIRLYDVFRLEEEKTGRTFVVVVMELADPTSYGLSGSSLWSCIETCVSHNMDTCIYRPEAGTGQFTQPIIGGEPMIRWIFLQVVSALDYLHRHPLYICNRDVKAENILVVSFEPHADNQKRPVCKLADFGFSKSASEATARTRLGTPTYIAPEVYLLPRDRSQSYDGAKADVWSAGVLLYILTTGLRPFVEAKADTASDIMQRISDARYLGRLFEHAAVQAASPELVDVLRHMLEHDPEQRYTMLQVMQHPWSKRLNGDILVYDERSQRATPLPCWDWYFAAVQAASEQARAAYVGKDARSEFVPFGWSLPHKRHEDVKEMLETVTKQAKGRPAAALVAMREGEAADEAVPES